MNILLLVFAWFIVALAFTLFSGTLAFFAFAVITQAKMKNINIEIDDLGKSLKYLMIGSAFVAFCALASGVLKP